MHFDTLIHFRRNAYACFERAADALMNTADALLTQTTATSLAELSLSPFFERRWPSVYEAFQDGRVNRAAMLKLFASNAPLPEAGKRLVLGGDASSIHRPQSKTARDRTYVHASNLPDGCKPVLPGWQFSELAVLPDKPSSWIYVLDNCRIDSTKTQGEVMAEQLRKAIALLPRRFVFIGDGYYGSEAFRVLCSDIDCDVLVRFAKRRVLYREPPETQQRRRGHPTWHGAPFRLHDPSTHGQPEKSWEGVDAHGHRIETACWHNLHFKGARHLKVCVARVTRHGAAGTKRDPRVSWFLDWGTDPPKAQEISPLYGLRYSMEHGYRGCKQDRIWEEPHLRTPEQFSLWTDILSVVQNELYLARELDQAQLQPWESKRRESTPEQVRRAMGRIIAELGTPARCCQRRGYSPGWPQGRPRTPAQTYNVIYKGDQDGAKVPNPTRAPPILAGSLA
jgi:hypothetical protein